jgi:glycosyltransferase involved in cell wall biosynthesis
LEHVPQLPPEEIARRLDGATLLVLPSWPEGLGRVVIEAFARGRGVVATNAGGIPDLVTHDVDGILVPPGDTGGLVEALERVLTDRELAERLGAGAKDAFDAWRTTPQRFASQMRELVDAALAGER